MNHQDGLSLLEAAHLAFVECAVQGTTHGGEDPRGELEQSDLCFIAKAAISAMVDRGLSYKSYNVGP